MMRTFTIEAEKEMYQTWDGKRVKVNVKVKVKVKVYLCF